MSSRPRRHTAKYTTDTSETVTTKKTVAKPSYKWPKDSWKNITSFAKLEDDNNPQSNELQPYRILLSKEKLAVTFLKMLMMHDKSHDMTMASRREGDVNLGYVEGEKTSNTSVASHIFSRKASLPLGIASAITAGGGQNGGNPADAFDPIYRDVINDPLDNIIYANEIGTRLLFGSGTIKQMLPNLWLDIKGRSTTASCLSSTEYCVYLNVQMLDFQISGPFWPGYVMINDEIISPFDVLHINPMLFTLAFDKNPLYSYENAFTILKGKYKNYTLVQGTAKDLGPTLFIYKTNEHSDEELRSFSIGANESQYEELKRSLSTQIEQPIFEMKAMLNQVATFEECFTPDITQQIISAVNEMVDSYIEAGDFTQPINLVSEGVDYKQTAFYILSCKYSLLEFAYLKRSVWNYGDLFKDLMNLNNEELTTRLQLTSSEGVQFTLHGLFEELHSIYVNTFNVQKGGDYDEMDDHDSPISKERSKRKREDDEESDGNEYHKYSRKHTDAVSYIEILRNLFIINSLTNENFFNGLAVFYLNNTSEDIEEIYNKLYYIPDLSQYHPFIASLYSNIQVRDGDEESSEYSGGKIKNNKYRQSGGAPALSAKAKLLNGYLVGLVDAIITKNLGTANYDDEITSKFALKYTDDGKPYAEEFVKVDSEQIGTGAYPGLATYVAFKEQDAVILPNFVEYSGKKNWTGVPKGRLIAQDFKDKTDKRNISDLLKQDVDTNLNMNILNQTGALCYINNSASMEHYINQTDGGDVLNLCPQASIADSMSSCSTVFNAVEKGVLEYGTQDVIIKSTPTVPLPFELRYRATPVIFEEQDKNGGTWKVCNGKNELRNSDGKNWTQLPTHIQISFYLEINGVVLANLQTVEARERAWKWPTKGIPHNGIVDQVVRYASGEDAVIEKVVVEGKEVLLDPRNATDAKRAYFEWIAYLRKVSRLLDPYEGISSLNWDSLVDKVLGNEPEYTGPPVNTPFSPETVLGTPSSDLAGEVKGTSLNDYLTEGKQFKLQDFERGCIEHSIVKTLGDFGQILTTVSNNGGYVQGPFYAAQTMEIGNVNKEIPQLSIDNVVSIPSYTPKYPQWNTPPTKLPSNKVKPPLDINLGRIGIHNDAPANALAMFLILFGEDETVADATPGMSSNTMSLYYKQRSKASPLAKIYGAYRGLQNPSPITAASFNGGARIKKTKKAHKKKRYTKKKGVTRPKPKTNKKHKKSRRPRRKAKKTRRKRMSKR